MKSRSALTLLALAVLLPSLATGQGVRFSGTLTDEDGNPVVGARVRAEVIGESSGISGAGKSNKKGRYGLFVMMPARQYLFTVEKEGYAKINEIYDVDSTWTNENLRLTHDFTLKKGSSEPAPVRVPDAVTKIYNDGVEAFSSGDLETARQKFETGLNLRPRVVPLHIGLARTCLRLGDYQQALDSATRAAELEKGNRDAVEIQIQAHRGLGNEDLAAELAQSLKEEASTADKEPRNEQP